MRKAPEQEGLACLCKQSQSEEAEEKNGKGAAEVRGPEMTGSPERRDVVKLCLQATVAQCSVALCVNRSEFANGLPQQTNNQAIFTPPLTISQFFRKCSTSACERRNNKNLSGLAVCLL